MLYILVAHPLAVMAQSTMQLMLTSLFTSMVPKGSISACIAVMDVVESAASVLAPLAAGELFASAGSVLDAPKVTAAIFSVLTIIMVTVAPSEAERRQPGRTRHQHETSPKSD